MKYSQPWGIVDPNAAYFNGNPTTGTQGSIPPAASIEHDQREIVEVIKWAYEHGYRDSTGTLCAAPTDLDLTQLRKALQGFMNADKLALNLTYYVNDATGDDANDGLTAGAPFLTIQKAIDESQKYDPNGFTITINVADGGYAPFTAGGGQLKGWGTVRIIGNVVSPSACLIEGMLNSGSPFCASFSGASRVYYIGGFKFVHPGVTPYGGYGIIVNEHAYVYVYNCDMGACLTYHLWASMGTLTLPGKLNGIPGVAFPYMRVSGNAGAHMRASQGGKFGSNCPDMTITGTLTITTWAVADSLSQMMFVGHPDGSQTTFYNSLTGAANVTSGKKYDVSANSIIISGGAPSTDYFPGPTAGISGSGGQYVP